MFDSLCFFIQPVDLELFGILGATNAPMFIPSHQTTEITSQHLFQLQVTLFRRKLKLK